MRKFKKFYIALLGGILALGVGTSSLVSSVSPTSVKAATTQTTTFTFNESRYMDGPDLFEYSRTIDSVTLQIITDDLDAGYPFYYDYFNGYIELHSDNTVYLSTTQYVISQVVLTTYSGNTISLNYNTSSVTITFTGTTRITQIDVTLYLTDLEEAEDWAQSFIDDLYCDEQGVNPPSVTEWAALQTSYDNLSAEAKAYFEDDRLEDESDIIEAAIKKYDYIQLKYTYGGNNNYPAFINRTPVPVSSANSIDNPISDTSVIIIAIVASVIALTSIGAFIIIYKRKRLSSK